MANNPAIPALVPLSVVHQGQRVDLALPSSVPVAELLPGMVGALGRLTATSATQGYRLVSADGSELDQHTSLDDQRVGAGAVLTLHRAGEAITDARYDDLAEAIGAAVAEHRTPWRREDSVQLSGFASTGLFVVAALMLALRGTNDFVTITLGAVGAGLVTLAAAVVQRMGILASATALALSAPVLLGAAGFAFDAGPATGLKSIFAGIGMLVGAIAALVLPARQRATIAAPVTVGIGLMILGALTTYAHTSAYRAGALVLTLATLLVLIIPWIGLAQMPARINALTLSHVQRHDADTVARQIGNADVTVVALRVGAGLLIVGMTPLVAAQPQGALLAGTAALACLLGTRSLHGRLEVLIGAITGMIAAVIACAEVSIAQPELLPWVVGAAIVVGVFVLAGNVLAPSARPWLTRAADVVHIVALIALLPLTGLIWGIL